MLGIPAIAAKHSKLCYNNTYFLLFKIYYIQFFEAATKQLRIDVT